MTTAMLPHWTGLDTAGIAVEAVAAFLLAVYAGSWVLEKWQQLRHRPSATAAPVVAHPRTDHQPYERPAYAAGDTTGEEPQ